MRKGHWIILDELNLAPSDVLEALNRVGLCGWLVYWTHCIKGSLGLTYGFDEQGERGRAMHADKVLWVQSSLVKSCPTPDPAKQWSVSHKWPWYKYSQVSWYIWFHKERNLLLIIEMCNFFFQLLDDNQELFIPETQETLSAHPKFMLFATQNPPGQYGGRKVSLPTNVHILQYF